MSKVDLSAQLKYFNAHVNKNLTPEQITEFSKYFSDSDHVSFDTLVSEIEATDFTTIVSKYGICAEVANLKLNEPYNLSRFGLFSVIARLSYLFYSEFSYLSEIANERARKVNYPIPSDKHFNITNKWVGFQLIRRLKYINWLTRQFKLISIHLKTRKSV